MVIRQRWLRPILLLLLTSSPLTLAVELRRVWSCSAESLRLRCPSENELIAVHSAEFTTENFTCGEISVPAFNRCREDIRSSLNNRCAGQSSCTFNFTDDHWHGECSALSEEGALLIYYDCVPVNSIQRYCNVQVGAPEGYLASPGYPGFFPKLPNCTWNLRAGPGQTLLLTVADLDLPHSRPHYGRPVCDDVLHVVDGTESKLLSVCGQQPPDTVESTGERVTVYFQTRVFTPFRGFLLYYRVHGCPTLPAPKLGYMVYRNGSTALYMCCEGHIFNDTLDNYRPIHCVDRYYWNATIPPFCVSIEELKEEGNWTGYLMDFVMDNATLSHGRHSRVSRMETDMLADIVIPSILMAGLIIGNAVVFLIIIRIRRSQKYLDEGRTPAEPKPSFSQEGAFEHA